MADYKALEYLSKASDFTVTKMYEDDHHGEPEWFIGYRIQMDDSSRYGDEMYAFVDVDDEEIGYYIRGGIGWDGFVARIDISKLKELIQFCETMTKGSSDGRQ